MSGHNKWSQIKHQKNAADQKRGQLFSKLLNAISIAAKIDPNPNFNPRLKAAIEKAKNANVPSDNITRAIKRASEKNIAIEEITLEAYGPGGSAMLIIAITDNKNRTIPEIKKVLANHGAKFAEPRSVTWAFEKKVENEEISWKAKFPQALNQEDRNKLSQLTEYLLSRDDVQKVYSNC